MKKIVYSLFVCYMVFACTNYNDDIRINVQNHETLTLEKIQTHLKVVNLKLDQNDFEQMYSNHTEEIEIKGVLDLYKEGVLLIENENVEVQIKGTFSAAFPLKSLGIKFEDTYNNQNRKLIDPELLSFHSLDKVKAFRLRNSGNDFHYTMLKDISYTKLAINAGLNLDLMYAEQTVVFVNGSFLGVMNLRTESNTNGMSRLNSADKKDVTLAKIVEGGIVEKKDGDFDRIDRFLTAISDADYDYVSKEIDIDNFIDYMIFESYIGNRDWPKNNVRFYAVKKGPFRFVLFDLDLAATQNIDGSLTSFINHPIDNPISDLFNIMYSNVEFKNMYNARFKALMNTGVLSSTKFNEIVNQYKSNLEHIMPTQIKKYNVPKTYTDWYINIEHLKNNFREREKHLN